MNQLLIDINLLRLFYLLAMLLNLEFQSFFAVMEDDRCLGHFNFLFRLSIFEALDHEFTLETLELVQFET